MALLKLDENLPDVAGEVLRTAGHDVALARDEGLAGAADDAVLAMAVSERRALITMDLDFSDVRRHPPAATSGIVILRLHDQTLPAVRRAMSRLAGLLSQEPLQGHLLDSRRGPASRLAGHLRWAVATRETHSDPVLCTLGHDAEARAIAAGTFLVPVSMIR